MDIKKEILEALDDELSELKEEIAYKKEEIKEKEIEIDEIEEFEADDEFVDDMLDSCYEDVLVINTKYPMSEILKTVDNNIYEDIRDEETNRYIEENTEELENELDELESELEELEENYEEEFKNE